MNIIALTNHGGMVIGKEYKVEEEIASILVSVKRAKYADESLNLEIVSLDSEVPATLPETESVPKTKRRRTTKK